MQRRRFVVATSAAMLSASLALWFRARGKEPGHATDQAPGPSLVRDTKGVLDLLPGFSYEILERAGTRMSDGFRVPARPDAMGCFRLGPKHWALMRNHELDRKGLAYGAYFDASQIPREAYDPECGGGVTRLVLDEQGRRISSNLVLTGTSRNCAGGISPWGFLSCEESMADGHGYVFLCSVQADRVRAPDRILAYGRFFHEAVAIDIRTSTAYLTEDRADGCLYRFVPQVVSKPFGAGTLQAMAVRDSPRFNIGGAMPRGRGVPITWIDVPVEAGEQDDSLRHVAHERGAAIVRRGEGIWFGEDGVFFTSTSGGPMGKGQILHLALGSLSNTRQGDMLSLIAQSEDERTLNMPDNLTVTPWGDLLVCEDNQRDAFLRLITRDGRVLPFAHNVLSASELAGVCFSPDGQLLFVNIQENGLTLVIRGPWQSLRAA